MKKLTLGILVAIIFTLFIPNYIYAEAENTTVTVVAAKPAVSVDATILVARVEAIKAMDFSTLNSTEKKELRKELRAIKTDLKKSNKRDVVATHGNGGIYLSVGAIIVIIILLIVIL